MIKFRPHHFLCSVGYKGMGYSSDFVANYDEIANTIRSDEETKIQVVFGLDRICSHCPHQNEQSNTCVDEKTINKLDRAHAAILNLYDQEILTFKEAKARIAKLMSLEQFHDACAPCEWKKLGVCEEALKNLKCSVIDDIIIRF